MSNEPKFKQGDKVIVNGVKGFIVVKVWVNGFGKEMVSYARPGGTIKFGPINWFKKEGK